jgi:hypothetical protein
MVARRVLDRVEPGDVVIVSRDLARGGLQAEQVCALRLGGWGRGRRFRGGPFDEGMNVARRGWDARRKLRTSAHHVPIQGISSASFRRNFGAGGGFHLPQPTKTSGSLPDTPRRHS